MICQVLNGQPFFLGPLPGLLEGSYNPDSSLGDCPWLLQLSIHSPKQGLVIIDESFNCSCRERVASTGAIELVQALYTRKVGQRRTIAIVCIHSMTQGE